MHYGIDASVVNSIIRHRGAKKVAESQRGIAPAAPTPREPRFRNAKRSRIG